MRPFKNNQGIGFIGFVMVIGIVFLGLVAAVFSSLSGAQKEAARFRQGTTSLLMMQQLGSVTLKAFNDFKVQADCLHVDGGATPVGNKKGGGPKAFCEPSQICISDPDDASVDNEPIVICGDESAGTVGNSEIIRFEKMVETKEGNLASIDFNIHHKSWAQKVKYAYYDFVLEAHKFVLDKLVYSGNTLQAQVAAPFDFNTGAPSVNKPSYCNQPGCANACFGTLCKECAATLGAVYPPDEVPCLRFRVCPKMSGCDGGNPSEWFVQKIGVIQNAPNPAGPL